MWSILFGIGGTVVQWIYTIYQYLTIKDWIALAACATTLMLGVKLLTSMFEFLKSLLSSKITRWALGVITVIGISFAGGYLMHGHTASVTSFPIPEKYSAKKYEVIVKDHVLYYPGAFINEFIKNKSFKETN